MGFKANSLERRLILGYSEIYKEDVKNMFPSHVTTLESYRLWLSPRHIVFIDQYPLADIKHLIATAKKSKCESVILISRCGFSERENNMHIRLIQSSNFTVEPNTSIRSTFNKIRENNQKKIKKWDFILVSRQSRPPYLDLEFLSIVFLIYPTFFTLYAYLLYQNSGISKVSLHTYLHVGIKTCYIYFFLEVVP